MNANLLKKLGRAQLALESLDSMFSLYQSHTDSCIKYMETKRWHTGVKNPCAQHHHRTSKLIYCQLQQFYTTSLVFLPKFPTPGFVWLPKSQFPLPRPKKKPWRNFLFLTTSLGLKIITLKANPIYLIFKCYDIGEGKGRGGSWLWNVWKYLAMLAMEGSETGLPPFQYATCACNCDFYI